MKKIFLLFLIFASVFSAQQINFSKLENEIYQNNREGKHELSQKKLLNLLGKSDLGKKDQVKLNLLLAATFRSINDYGAAINYLKKSNEIVENLEGEDSLKMSVYAEMAFVYFDNNNYSESEKIIKDIELKKYKNLDENSKAYIVMQQGYIYFLNKKYNLAEKNYENALIILKKVSRCNQPAVLVKQMQLFGAQNKLLKVEETYKNISHLADSCNILKYKIYATEEIKEIYKRHNNKEKSFIYSKALDSLNDLYDRDNSLSSMHVSSEEFLQQQTDKERTDKVTTTVIYTIALLLVVMLGIYFYRRSTLHKKEVCRIEAELLRIKEELKIYSQSQFSHEVENNDILTSEKLNNRQKELLKLVAQGLTNKEIAEKLSVTEATVKYHIRNIYSILDIKNRKDILIKLSRK